MRSVDFKGEISYHITSNKEKIMVRHKSAIRQWRRSLRRSAVNKKNKSELRSQIKKLRAEIKNKDKAKTLELLPQTFSVIDKAVKKGAIHENKGARLKSRLSRQVEIINPSPSK